MEKFILSNKNEHALSRIDKELLRKLANLFGVEYGQKTKATTLIKDVIERVQQKRAQKGVVAVEIAEQDWLEGFNDLSKKEGVWLSQPQWEEGNDGELEEEDHDEEDEEKESIGGGGDNNGREVKRFRFGCYLII